MNKSGKTVREEEAAAAVMIIMCTSSEKTKGPPTTKKKVSQSTDSPRNAPPARTLSAAVARAHSELVQRVCSGVEGGRLAAELIKVKKVCKQGRGTLYLGIIARPTKLPLRSFTLMFVLDLFAKDLAEMNGPLLLLKGVHFLKSMPVVNCNCCFSRRCF